MLTSSLDPSSSQIIQDTVEICASVKFQLVLEKTDMEFSVPHKRTIQISSATGAKANIGCIYWDCTETFKLNSQTF